MSFSCFTSNDKSFCLKLPEELLDILFDIKHEIDWDQSFNNSNKGYVYSLSSLCSDEQIENVTLSKMDISQNKKFYIDLRNVYLFISGDENILDQVIIMENSNIVESFSINLYL